MPLQLQHLQQQQSSSLANSDVVSIGGRSCFSTNYVGINSTLRNNQVGRNSNNDRRCKYNTLTPAEAKKFNKSLAAHSTHVYGSRAPVRTASVLHKPRPPPPIVTPIDNDCASTKQTTTDCPSRQLSDDSYMSARSQQSESNCNYKLSPNKNSLSASTTKVFHNSLSSWKRFFRYMPTRRSLSVNSNKNPDETDNKHDEDGNSVSSRINPCDLDLNRSQSPPICPPPPGKLKSVSYMESTFNYSNYDEFTRARNELNTAGPKVARSNTSSNYSSPLVQDLRQRLMTRQPQHPRVPDDKYLDQSESDNSDAWQLTSLPVNYEKNLSTLFEERRSSGFKQQPLQTWNIQEASDECDYSFKTNHRDNNLELPRPPSNFAENLATKTGVTTTMILSDSDRNVSSSTNSSQSLTSADSVLDHHKKTATSFRFSYAQPNSFQHVSFRFRTWMIDQDSHNKQSISHAFE